MITVEYTQDLPFSAAIGSNKITAETAAKQHEAIGGKFGDEKERLGSRIALS